MDAFPDQGFEPAHVSRTESSPTARAVAACVAAAACLLIGWFPFVKGTSVPFLWYVDLGFHELGHMLTMWAPRLIYFAMGSVNQILVPLGLSAYFLWIRRDRIGGGLCLAWAGTSAANVAVYVADAPYQRLPLIGGIHDWAYILGPQQLNMLGAAHGLGVAVKTFGALCVLGGFALCCSVAASAIRALRPAPVKAPAAPVRPARPAPSGDPVDMWR
jgi:hypothetical protein